MINPKDMDPIAQPALNGTIGLCLSEIRKRLDNAASTARIAETCAMSGDMKEAMRILLDIEPITYEVDRLLSVTTTIRRVVKT